MTNVNRNLTIETNGNDEMSTKATKIQRKENKSCKKTTHTRQVIQVEEFYIHNSNSGVRVKKATSRALYINRLSKKHIQQNDIFRAMMGNEKQWEITRNGDGAKWLGMKSVQRRINLAR